MRRLVTVLSACLSACGDNQAPPEDAAPGMAPFRPAPHAPLPRVLPHNGTVLPNVQLVTLTFDGYAARTEVEMFGDAVVKSDWYTAVGGEYGIGPGTHGPGAHLGAAPASLTRRDIAALIKQQMVSGNLPVPPAVGNQLLYIIYIPPEVTRGADLEGVVAYHQMSTITPAGTPFPFVVVLDDGLDPVATKLAAAHQLINAVVNPYDPPNGGYYADPPMLDPWSLTRGEVADLCDCEPPVMEGRYALPRVYSDAAAKTGTTPCVPFVPGETWSDVTPEPLTMRRIQRGGTAAFSLTGWSTHEMPPWKLLLRVADFSDLSKEDMRPELSSDEINNSATVELTLHAPDAAALGATGGIYVLSGVNRRPWPVGFVVVR